MGEDRVISLQDHETFSWQNFDADFDDALFVLQLFVRCDVLIFVTYQQFIFSNRGF